jgi:superfamily II DNA or RNA helicase
MFTYMVVNALSRGNNALIVTDRVELLKQAGGSFERFGISPQMITAGSEPDLTLPCHVAMVETLARRADDYAVFLASRKLVVFDEAHKANFDKIFPYLSNDCYVIGATATPERKGNQISLEMFYSDIVQPVDTPHLIELGFLSKAKTYGIPIDLKGVKKVAGEYDPKALADRYAERKVYEGVIENYNLICPNTKTLAFSASISQSEMLCERMQNAGLNARHLDSNITTDERNETLHWFRNTDNAILCNVGILTTGFDCPDVRTIILYRATTSLPLFLQMCGRGSRITDDKTEFTILDFGNNVFVHDRWEAPRTWSLKKKEKKKRNAADVAPIKNCPKCNNIVSLSAKQCDNCGHKFKEEKDPNAVNEFVMLQLLPPRDRVVKLNAMTWEERAHLCKTAPNHREGMKMAASILHKTSYQHEAERFIDLLGKSFNWFRTKEARDRYSVLRGEGSSPVLSASLEYETR